MTKPSTASPPKEVRGKPAERQKWAVEQVKKCAKASKRLGLTAHADLLGRAGLALRLPLAAAPDRTDRDRVRRAREALEADPRRLRRRGRRRLLRAPSGRGPVRRRDLRALSRRGRRPQALRDQLRPVALRAAAARLSRIHRHLPRADQGVPRQGRASSTRPDGRASIPATRRGSNARAASARWATGRSISARSSPSWRSTAIRPGRCSNGSAA